MSLPLLGPEAETKWIGSPLGRILLAAEEGALVGLWFEGQKYFPDPVVGREGEKNRLLFSLAEEWLSRYFAGENPPPALPLAPKGSAFRLSVWRLLRQIPYGETLSYSALAERLAAGEGRKALPVRAVAGAVAHNPISLLIPCHRVIGKSGELTGYAGGIDRKRWLLTLEGAEF